MPPPDGAPADPRRGGGAPPSRPRVETQVSAGGVAFRGGEGGLEVALISVGAPPRWQLPKGTVEAGETEPQTAAREVREETGLEVEVLERLDTIEYWYQGRTRGELVRYHKYVHFFLLRHLGGDVADHDGEVNEARFFPIEEALRRLVFANERRVLALARDRIAARAASSER